MTLKREEGESFEDYKKRRKEYNEDVKRRSRGRLVWNSSRIVQKPDGDITDFVKARVEGTYVKGVGKLHDSQSEKNKYDSLKEKAIKKRLLERKDATT